LVEGDTMHNWWIAALEHFGIISREEAEHISEEIRLSIHKDRYVETYQELELILNKQTEEKTSTIFVLQNKIAELEAAVETLQAQKTIASKK